MLRKPLSMQVTMIPAARPTLFLAVLFALAPPANAALWKEVGHPDDTSTDKVFIDMESISQNGEYRQAMLMTVYGHPRLFANQLLIDRHNLTEAFDCQGKRVSAIVTAGFLEGNPVGGNKVNADWKSQFSAVPDDHLSQTVFALACSASSVPKAPPLPRSTNDNHAPAVSSSAGLRTSSGTGMAVSTAGLVLTNHHVINGCGQLAVRAGDGQAGSATVEAFDAKNDLALIRTTMHFNDVARFRTDSRPPKLGESVGVVGYPLTGFLSSAPKATFGEVTSLAGAGDDYSRLQISAPVQPGNSGSPVLDASGSVIGVVVAEAAMSVAAIAGNVPQNVNFAVRGEVAQTFMRDHGVSFATADLHDRLNTEDVADKGQKVAVLIVCSPGPQ